MKVNIDLHISVDFLAVRQIPLKEHAYIHSNEESTSQTGPDRPLDEAATSLLHTIQSIVQSDRDIYDKVSLASFYSV